MFKEALQNVVDNTVGGVAGLLMDAEGIAVDQYTAQADDFEVESVGMEYSVVLKTVANASQMLQAGATEELTVKTERLVTLIRMVTDQYFVAITLRPDANVGKARYLLRVQASRLVDELN